MYAYHECQDVSQIFNPNKDSPLIFQKIKCEEKGKTCGEESRERIKKH